MTDDVELEDLLARYELAKKETMMSLNLLDHQCNLKGASFESAQTSWSLTIDRESLVKKKVHTNGELDKLSNEINELESFIKNTQQKYLDLFWKLFLKSPIPNTNHGQTNVSSVLYYDFVRQPSADVVVSPSRRTVNMSSRILPPEPQSHIIDGRHMGSDHPTVINDLPQSEEPKADQSRVRISETVSAETPHGHTSRIVIAHVSSEIDDTESLEKTEFDRF